MKTFFTLLFVSLLGLVVALGVIYYGDMKQSGNNIAISSFKLPYKSFIAGTGIVESGSKNIVIGSSVGGIVKEVAIQSGDKVHKGQFLFRIDDSKISINLPILKAQIATALSQVESAKHQLDIIQKMQDVSVSMVTKEKYTKLLDNYNEAKANLKLAQQKYKALLKQQKLYKVYAPIDGIILHSDITVGSYFAPNSQALVLGSNHYNIKVNINEFDAWKFHKCAQATAFIRGNPEQKVQLSYLYTIPMIKPKTNLTGSPTEQSDTRVLQIVYQINKQPDFPLYVGEILDVFIQNIEGE
ncbi:hypothetical protein MNB_SM-3-546 [hydrothermal vent metagenome]|uniref:Multidrug resistance protein MdtA-like barrel-sandwich hybrid domain-containing protein n=1 Tax=hydrothermal vent metagenome TaxID=652676 RepID=A0A1W1D1X5_9ZZZZ